MATQSKLDMTLLTANAANAANELSFAVLYCTTANDPSKEEGRLQYVLQSAKHDGLAVTWFAVIAPHNQQMKGQGNPTK